MKVNVWRKLTQFVLMYSIFVKDIQVNSFPPPRMCQRKVNDSAAVQKTVCARPKKMCFTLWKQEMKDGKESTTVLRQGCWYYENNPNETCGVAMCVASHGRTDNYFCCCEKDFCNRDFMFEKASLRRREKKQKLRTGFQDSAMEKRFQIFSAMIYCATTLLVVVSVTVAVLLWRRKSKKKEIVHENSHGAVPSAPDFTSETSFISLVSKGKFGEIWKATMNSKVVAIKKFHSSNKKSWINENKIYKLGLEHPGILKYFGGAITNEADTVSFLLFVEYHEKGSLRQVLRSTTLSWEEMCTMSHSVADALSYLHGEKGRTFKIFPCIVHRDITSANILVKDDGSCVLCDFGLSRAMSRDGKGKYTVTDYNQQVGSLRYMAPEVLEGHINLNDVVSQLKQIDIYALGVVLWEISSRCGQVFADNAVPRFSLPFDELESELTLQSLKNYVLSQKGRPSFPCAWKTHAQSTQKLQELINECWDQEPEARLSASCVCNRIVQLKQHQQK